MARKQTRRSISIKTESYDLVKAWCDVYKISMSSFVEERIVDFFDGVERTAKSVQEAEGEWTPSYPDPPKIEERYPGSNIRKERLTPAEPKPIRGGGVHEL
jgi:hypothetical protein